MASISTSRRPPPRMPKRLLAVRSDEVLAARAAAGDDGAFEVLYERHVAGVLSFCRHMLGGVEEAEDAAQHSFAALHGELVRGVGDLHLRPWLYTVARNRCLSTLRVRRERPDDALEPQTAGLTDELERRADLRELLADLHDLPSDQRAALVLSELGDLTQAEVGDVLDTDVAKVKGLVFRARSGLIERREARAASCAEIRSELATARRGGLRRGRLRHHLRACPDCTAYLGELRRQRRMMALLLPVVPSVGLKRGIFAAAGLGTGAGVGGVALSKVVVIGAVAGTAAVAGGTAAELSGRDGAVRPGVQEGREAERSDRRPGAPAAPRETDPSGRSEAGSEALQARGRARRSGGDAGPAPVRRRDRGSRDAGPAEGGAPGMPPGRTRARGGRGRRATPAPGQAPAGEPRDQPSRGRGAPGISEGEGGGGGSQPGDRGGSQPSAGSGSQRPGGDSSVGRPGLTPPSTTPLDGG